MYSSRLMKFSENLRVCKRHQATLINGKLIAKKILAELKISVDNFTSCGNHVPTLTVVLVGTNPASDLYLRNKLAAANSVGIYVNVLRFHSEVSENSLVKELTKLNNDDSIDAVLLQLPLPNHINKNITNLISAEKDVDGFTSTNFGKFCLGLPTFVPCTALAVRTIIQHIGKDIAGTNAVVCGRSKHVGLPIAMLLHFNFQNFGFNANTVICHRFTPLDNLTDYCRNADVLISATGVPSLIRGHMVKEGAIVIDVGITRVVEPLSSKVKLIGDVDYDEVSQVAGFITPVPGGVGPLTVAMLLENTFVAAKRRRSKK